MIGRVSQRTAPGLLNLVGFFRTAFLRTELICILEHTLLVTEDGVEILTARLPDSPGGPVARIQEANGEAAAAST